MRVPGFIFSNSRLMKSLKEDQSLSQVANVATLPGIIGHSLAMPDMHWGYGFPIGGVAAFDMDEGIISPGGVGYDINCGCRLMTTRLRADEIRPMIKDLVTALVKNIPAGVGSTGFFSGSLFSIVGFWFVFKPAEDRPVFQSLTRGRLVQRKGSFGHG